MAELRIPAAWLLLPLLAWGAYWGFRRGWMRETITGLGLALILTASARLTAIVLGVLTLIGRIAREVAAAGGIRVAPPERVLARIPEPLLLGVSTAAFVLAAYRVALLVRGGDGGSRLSKLAGAGIGALNVLLLLAIGSQTIRQMLGPARLRRLFLVPGAARGVDVRVPPFPSPAVLAQWSAYAVVVLLLVALGWGLTRLPRLRG